MSWDQSICNAHSASSQRLSARLALNHGFRAHDLKEIAGIIEENEALILEKWNEFFRP
jgi:hypothetical protein